MELGFLGVEQCYIIKLKFVTLTIIRGLDLFLVLKECFYDRCK